MLSRTPNISPLAAWLLVKLLLLLLTCAALLLLPACAPTRLQLQRKAAEREVRRYYNPTKRAELLLKYDNRPFR